MTPVLIPTEAEKLDYFVGTLGLNHSYLPQDLPIAPGANYNHTSLRRQVSAVSLGRLQRACACGRILLCGWQHREAFGDSIPTCCHTRNWSVGSKVFGSSIWLTMSGCFRRLSEFSEVTRVEAARVARGPDIERLREHFRVRDLLDRGETSSFGKSRWDRLREQLSEFGGLQYETLYGRRWEQGDCVLGTVHTMLASAQEP